MNGPAGPPEGISAWVLAAMIGGWIGATHGSRRLKNLALMRLLAVVLAIASVKLVFAV